MAVPEELLPPGFEGQKGYLVARVLPVGFINSVAIAQHIHRNVVRNSLGGLRPPLGGEAEIRRDRMTTSSSSLYRVYLDNFDQLRRVDRATAAMLREAYAKARRIRHPKKAVEQSRAAGSTHF